MQFIFVLAGNSNQLKNLNCEIDCFTQFFICYTARILIMMVFRLVFSYKRHFTTSKGAKRLETGKTKRTLHVKNAFPSFANFWIDKTRLKRIFFLKLWKKMVLFFKSHSIYHNFKRDISSILFSLKNIKLNRF